MQQIKSVRIFLLLRTPLMDTFIYKGLKCAIVSVKSLASVNWK